MLIPLPEANARSAALLSKQVDWIEAPAPDAIDQIKSQGFHLYANTQPHLWPGSSPLKRIAVAGHPRAQSGQLVSEPC